MMPLSAICGGPCRRGICVPATGSSLMSTAERSVCGAAIGKNVSFVTARSSGGAPASFGARFGQ